MSDKIIYDQFGSAVRTLHTQDDGGFAIQTTEDVEPIIEQARMKRENNQRGANWHYEGSIPMSVVEKAMREGWYNDQDAWRKWLADPDNKRLRGL